MKKWNLTLKSEIFVCFDITLNCVSVAVLVYLDPFSLDTAMLCWNVDCFYLAKLQFKAFCSVFIWPSYLGTILQFNLPFCFRQCFKVFIKENNFVQKCLWRYVAFSLCCMCQIIYNANMLESVFKFVIEQMIWRWRPESWFTMTFYV